MSWWKGKRDASLYGALMHLPNFFFFHMVRPDKNSVVSSKEAFFNHGRAPQFTYKQTAAFDTKRFRMYLDEAEIAMMERPAETVIKTMYREKFEGLRTRLKLIEGIQAGADHEVTVQAIKLYGEPEYGCKELEEELNELASHKKKLYKHKNIVTHDLLQKMVSRLLDEYDMKRFGTKSFNGTSVTIRHNIRKGLSKIYLPKKRDISKARAARLLTHEIEVHALRRANGLASPYAILSHSTNGYLETEEGLALYFQNKLRSNHSHGPGFWDAYTICLMREFSFVDVFEKLVKGKKRVEATKINPATEEVIKESAWQLCMRAYRGITDTNQPGVGYVRDHVYRSGLKVISDLVRDEGEGALTSLFLGRIGVKHRKDVLDLNLPNPIVPRMISKEIVREVLREAKK